MNNKVESTEEQKSIIETDGAQSKKCYICSKGFNFRKKHICRFCTNAVCTDHCQKARSLEGYDEPQPICDLCNQEIIKQEMQAEIRNEIQSLDEELKSAKAMNERLDREHFEKTAAINKLENEIEGINKNSVEDLKALQEELENEENKYKEIKELHDKVKDENLKIKQQESEISEALFKAQENLESIRRQSEILKETKEGLNEQLDKINSKLKGSLSVDKVSRLLCQNCASKMEECSRQRMEAPSILEDASSNMSVVDERQSVMQSVREYKEILSNQNSRPTESNGCITI